MCVGFVQSVDGLKKRLTLPKEEGILPAGGFQLMLQHLFLLLWLQIPADRPLSALHIMYWPASIVGEPVPQDLSLNLTLSLSHVCIRVFSGSPDDYIKIPSPAYKEGSPVAFERIFLRSPCPQLPSCFCGVTGSGGPGLFCHLQWWWHFSHEPAAL